MAAPYPDAAGTLERARRFDSLRRGELNGTMDITAPARQTRQRNAIRTVFLRESRPLTAEEVRFLANHASIPLSLATVYRNLRAMVQEGWLAPVELPGRNTIVYERASQEHHHYFECRRCKAVYELEGCCLRGQPFLAGRLHLLRACILCLRPMRGVRIGSGDVTGIAAGDWRSRRTRYSGLTGRVR